MHHKKMKKMGLSSAVKVMVVFGLVASGSLGVATAATAAEISAITAVTISKKVLSVNTAFDVSAEWVAPANAQAGDTFTLTFPSEVEAYASVIDLKDPSGNVVGTCDVSANSFLCTLSNYVDTHDNVHGTLWFHAIAKKSTADTELVFVADNNVKFAVPLDAGIGVVEEKPLPTQVVKDGWMEQDGENIRWRIRVPGSALAAVNGQDVVFTDTYDVGLMFNESSFQVAWSPVSAWPTFKYNVLSAGTKANTYSITNSPETNSFSAVIHQPVADGNRIYELSYTTRVPNGAASGHVYGNSIAVDSQAVSQFNVRYVSAGGNGIGDSLGDFTITKMVTGTGAGEVTGASYVVRYSYDDRGSQVTGDLVVANGSTSGIADLPVGTVVSLSELAPDSVAHVLYGTPIFGGDGVTPTADGATVTIQDDVAATVSLENPVSRVPTSEETPTPAAPASVPSATPAGPDAPTTAPDGASAPLAATGAEAGPAVLFAGVLLVVGGAIVIRRRLLATG